jgi:Stage II sporulation protein E (SpoIIE)
MPISSFWRTVPRSSLLIFLLGVFCIFTTFGFAGDVSDMGRQSGLHFAVGVLLSGLFAVSYALTGIVLRGQFWKAFVPLFLLQFVLMNLLANWLPNRRPLAQLDATGVADLHSRLAFDTGGIMVAVLLGYACFVYTSITEGRRYLRVQAEIELAAEIHRVLVPAIDTTLGGFEFYGRSIPSGQVGGDLIDLAGSEDQWVAYLADVSGHGVAPGVIMGMAKSAARMLLSSGADPGTLLSRLNEVLYPLKKPDMFVTFCFLAKSPNAMRVGLAGHPAILHVSGGSHEVRPLECPNMPLGILPSGAFATSEITAEEGDLFALYTDGLLETTNGAGEEFGLKRLEKELCKQATEPLEAIYRSIQESVARHGAQFDDQSLFLVRRL